MLISPSFWQQQHVSQPETKVSDIVYPTTAGWVEKRVLEDAPDYYHSSRRVYMDTFGHYVDE